MTLQNYDTQFYHHPKLTFTIDDVVQMSETLVKSFNKRIFDTVHIYELLNGVGTLLESTTEETSSTSESIVAYKQSYFAEDYVEPSYNSVAITLV